jgi:glycosyltransferase involved in cell wall biosynthesis
MKVCIVTPEFPREDSPGRGGVGTYSETLASALLARGVEVHVVIYRDHPLTGSLRSDLPVRLHYVQLPWVRYFSSLLPGLWQSLVLARFLRRLDRVQRFDVIEMYNDEGITLFPLLAFRSRTALRFHTSVRQHVVNKGERFIWRRRFSAWLDKMAARAAAHMVTHSRFHVAEMADEYGIDPQKILMIPHCTRGSEAAGCDTSLPVVGYIGALDRRKGIDVFLNSIPGILERCPQARILIVGKDMGCQPGMSWKDWYLKTHGPDTRVDFTGSVTNSALEDLWHRIGIIVVPSRYESFGLIVIEGFARRKAVVASAASALQEVAEGGAILISPENSPELSEVVVELIQDPELREKIASDGYRRYQAHYGLDVFAGRVYDFYQGIAAGSRRVGV